MIDKAQSFRAILPPLLPRSNVSSYNRVPTNFRDYPNGPINIPDSSRKYVFHRRFFNYNTIYTAFNNDKPL